MSVSGSSAASPSRAVSRLRNSMAPSESSPASISGASADTLGSSSAATSRTIETFTGTQLATVVGASPAVCALRSFVSSPMPPTSAVTKGDCSTRDPDATGCGAVYSHRVTSINPYLRPAAPSGVGDAVSSR